MKQEKSNLWRFVLHDLLMILLLMCVIRPQIAKAETVEGYELSFNPRTTGLPEELDKGNTDYAYKDFELRSNGEAKQAVYRALEEVANSFWGCTENMAVVEGEQYALLATIHTVNLNLSAEELMEVYLMFKNDHPVYYFLSNTVSVSGTDLLVMTNVVNGTDRANMEKNLADYLKGYASCIDVTSDYLTAKELHDTLVGKLDYSYEEDGVTPEDEYWAHSIEGAVMRNQGVCEAYAKTYQMLLNYYGIENVYVTGVAGGDNHAWNMVKLDGGQYYYVDATWNDTSSTEQYFACGEDFTQTHTSGTPNGTGKDYLYELPEAAEDSYVKKVAVYQDGELIGKYSSFEQAFELITDENGQYCFEIIGSAEESYGLPEGEWPKAKLLEFSYMGNDSDSEYYMVTSLVFTGNVYLNSDVKFNDVSLDCALDNYISDGIPTLYARTYTMYFAGRGNYLGGSSVIVSPEEVYSMGLRIEGPEATLVSDASDRFEMYASDITIGTVYMNSWLSIRGGSFVCDTLTFSEEVTQMTWSSFYNTKIKFDVDKLIVETGSFSIFNDYPTDSNSYRIGELVQNSGYVTLHSYAGTGKKIPNDITIEHFDNLTYSITYKDVSGYTEEQLEELYREAELEGDSAKCNFYYDLLIYMTMYMNPYPSESPEELLPYKGTLLNIGITDLENLQIFYTVKKDYSGDISYDLNDFLEVDSEGNVYRAKDEALFIEDGVLKKVKFFNQQDVIFTVPDDVVAISNAGFDFTGISELIISKNVAQISLGYNEFSCITVVEENETYASLDGVLYNKDFTTLLACPARKTGTLIIPDSVTTIEFGAFSYSNLNELVIPASVESVQNLDGKWEKVFVDAKEIATSTFYGNGRIQELTFGEHVEIINGYVCESCAMLEEVYLLNPTVVLDACAFAYSGRYTEEQEKGVVTTIYGYAGSTAEEYVTTYGAEYGLVFSALPAPSPTPTPEVVPGNDSVGTVDPSITDENITADTITEALEQNAEANNAVLAEAVPEVEVSAEEIETALGSDFVADAEVTVEVRPFLNVSVTELDSASNSMTLDIKAQYGVYAVQGENEAQIGETGTLDVANQAMTITVPLPSNFATKNIIVNHKKMVGGVETVVETLAAVVDETAGTLTFTTEKGFSTFEVVGISVKHNLNLESAIDLSFFIAKESLEDITGLTGVITHKHASGDKTVTAAWESVTTGGVEYWRLRYTGVAAKEMSDELVMKVTDTEGNIIITDIYSIRDYAMSRISKTSNANELSLMTELLNYGAAAQVFFGYKTEDLANAELGTVAVQYTVNAAVATLANSTIAVRHNLNLESEIDLSFFIAKTDLADTTGLTKVITHSRESGDKTATPVWESVITGGVDYWRLRYAGVAAKEMSDTLYLVVEDDTGVVVEDIYSIKAYAMSRISKTSNEAEYNLMTALLNYGASAQMYFNYKTGELANADLTSN